MTKSHAQSNGKPSDISLANVFPKLRERVKALRTARHLTLAMIAKKTGLSKPTLYRLIRGKGNPLLSNYVKLAECLGTSVSYLLGPQRSSQPRTPRKQSLAEALLADPPAGDLRAREIYDAVCTRARSSDEIYELVKATRFNLPGEAPQAAVTRAILDVYHHMQAWIDPALLPRDHDLERDIEERFKLPKRPELVDRRPVRVIELDTNLDALVQIHALAAVAAALIAELLQTHTILGCADGFAASTVQRFLRRGSLPKAELVPLTHNPRYVHYEMSGATLVGAMARTHYGYQVRSTLDLRDLRDRIEDVEVAILSCGSVLKLEPKSRLARVVRESRSQKTYEKLVQELQEKKVVGDLLYHFLKADGEEVPIPSISRSFETATMGELYPKTLKGSGPTVYTISLKGLADIAERGVSMLLVHSEERASIARAALKRERKPVNFVVTSQEAAKKLMSL